MLVLTRRLLESVVIGDDIEVFILEIRGDRVRLGIKAPKDVPVHRREVYEEIRRSNIEAAAVEGAEGLERLLEEGLPGRGKGRVKRGKDSTD
ncbi:MAG: carbon storage regulator CsrA [Candidatus Geothermincolales bacterium]